MEKSVFISDNNGNLLQGLIKESNNLISIRFINENNELLAYTNLFLQPHNRIFLSEIYCYSKYRGNGIATKLSELTDYVLRNYEGYIIRGIYHPTEMSSDLKNIKVDKKELDIRARNYYLKNDYEILNYYNYLDNQEKYKYLNIEDDFRLNGSIAENIVYKVIKKKEYNFIEDNGVIYYLNNNVKNR